MLVYSTSLHEIIERNLEFIYREGRVHETTTEVLRDTYLKITFKTTPSVDYYKFVNEHDRQYSACENKCKVLVD